MSATPSPESVPWKPSHFIEETTTTMTTTSETAFGEHLLLPSDHEHDDHHETDFEAFLSPELRLLSHPGGQHESLSAPDHNRNEEEVEDDEAAAAAAREEDDNDENDDSNFFLPEAMHTEPHSVFDPLPPAASSDPSLIPRLYGEAPTHVSPQMRPVRRSSSRNLENYNTNARVPAASPFATPLSSPLFSPMPSPVMRPISLAMASAMDLNAQPQSGGAAEAAESLPAPSVSPRPSPTLKPVLRRNGEITFSDAQQLAGKSNYVTIREGAGRFIGVNDKSGAAQGVGQRRLINKNAEQRRRDKLKTEYEQLREILASPEGTSSRIELVTLAYKCIKEQREQMTRLHQRIIQLEGEVDSLVREKRRKQSPPATTISEDSEQPPLSVAVTDTEFTELLPPSDLLLLATPPNLNQSSESESPSESSS